MSTNNIFFTGERFNAVKQSERLLKKVDLRKMNMNDIVELAFNTAFNECEGHYNKRNRQSRETDKQTADRVLISHRQLKRKCGTSKKLATMPNIRADVYRRLNKRFSVDVVDEIINAAFDSVKEFLLLGVVVRIDKFIEFFLRDAKPYWNINTSKWRIGAKRVGMKIHGEYQHKIMSIYPFDEVDKSDLANPFSNE